MTVNALVNDMKFLSLNQEQDYYIMDNFSDSTINHAKNQPQKNNHRDLEKFSHSFTSKNNNTDHIQTKTLRFSFISKVKKVFRKKKPSSLPVLTTDQPWNPSIDSISSSATLVRPDQLSIHSSQSSFTQDKSTLSRHSCGINPSSLFHKKRATKSILREPPLPRPKSLFMEERKKRWSNARFSVYEHQTTPSTTKNRYTVLTMMQQPKSKKVVQCVRFNKYDRIHETYSKYEYDRSSDTEAVCNRLTPEIAKRIKHELNTFKDREMVVHEHSKIYNHFFI